MDFLTSVHVALSLVGIGAGFYVMYGLLRHAPLERWTTVFLGTTFLTSVTGFLASPGPMALALHRQLVWLGIGVTQRSKAAVLIAPPASH